MWKRELVDHQQRRVGYPVGKPRLGEAAEALRPAPWLQPAAAGDVLEKFDDDRAVKNRRAVGEQQAGHFAERILLAQRVILVERVRRHDGDASSEAENVGRDAHLAPIG